MWSNNLRSYYVLGNLAQHMITRVWNHMLLFVSVGNGCSYHNHPYSCIQYVPSLLCMYFNAFTMEELFYIHQLNKSPKRKSNSQEEIPPLSTTAINTLIPAVSFHLLFS